RRLLRGKRVPQKPAAREVQTEVRGDRRDDYVLALLMRLRELEEPVAFDGDVDFVLPESRELYRHLGDEIPPHLEPFADRARRYLADTRRLTPPKRLLDEIDDRVREIREAKVLEERKQASLLRREGAIDDAELNRLLKPSEQHFALIAQAHDAREAG